MSSQIGALINGHVYDWSSVELSIGGKPFTAVTEINYTQTLEPGHLRGTTPHKLGRTRGQYEADGSVTMYLGDYDILCGLLLAQAPGRGYMEASFLITVMYAEPLSGTIITDILQGCRIKSEQKSHSAGNEPLMVAADIDIMRMVLNGKFAVLDNTGIP